MKKRFPGADELRRCYPPVTDEYRRMIRQTVNALTEGEEKKVKMKWSVGIAAAVLLCLAMTTAVAAITGGVIGYLNLGQRDGFGKLAEMVEPIAAEATLEGVTVRVEDALTDGRRLAFSVSASSADPEQMYLLEGWECTVNGKHGFAPVYEMTGQGWLPGFFGGDTQGEMSLHGGVLGDLLGDVLVDEGADSLDVVMTFRVSRPAQRVAIVDGLIYKEEKVKRMYGEDARFFFECVERLRGMKDVTVADEAQLSPEWWAEQGYTVLDMNGELVGAPDECYTGTFFTAIHAEDQLECVGMLDVRFTVPVERGVERVMAAEDARLDDGGVIAFGELLHTPLTYKVACTLTFPADDLAEAVRYCAAHGFDGDCLTFADAQGRAIEFPDSYGETEYYAEPREVETGLWRYECSWELIPAEEMPREIHLLGGGEDADEALVQEIFRKAVLTW